MTLGSGLARLGGYPFEVRYSNGALVRARAAADVAASAYRYLSRLFSGVEPDIAVIVADAADWHSRLVTGVGMLTRVRPFTTSMSSSGES